MDRCENILEYLAAYADGELDGELGERVARHLDSCESCRKECAGLSKVAELYRASEPPEVAPREWERISDALEKVIAERAVPLEAVRRASGSRWAMGWWLFPAVATAAAVLLAVALIQMPGSPESSAGAGASASGVQVMDIEAGANYEYSVVLPANDDDFLIIDVTGAE